MKIIMAQLAELFTHGGGSLHNAHGMPTSLPEFPFRRRKVKVPHSLIQFMVMASPMESELARDIKFNLLDQMSNYRLEWKTLSTRTGREAAAIVENHKTHLRNVTRLIKVVKFSRRLRSSLARYCNGNRKEITRAITSA